MNAFRAPCLLRHVHHGFPRPRYVNTGATKIASRKLRLKGTEKKRKYRIPNPNAKLSAKGNKITTRPGQHGGASKRLGAEHGRHIYVYHHLVSNQVLYSLDTRLKNLASLRQIPFTGKQSKPAALRKDHWHQLAMVRLPEGSGDVGRSIYSKLREFKRLHEISWDPSIMRKENNELVSRKDRRKILNNQTPIAVADMAAIFAKLERDDDNIGLVGVGKGIEVEVLWSNMADAYYAARWSDNVVHDHLQITYNNRDSSKERPFNKKMKNYIAQKEGLTQEKSRSNEQAITRRKTKGRKRRNFRRAKARVLLQRRTSLQDGSADHNHPGMTSTDVKSGHSSLAKGSALAKNSDLRTLEEKRQALERHRLMMESAQKESAQRKAENAEKHRLLVESNQKQSKRKKEAAAEKHRLYLETKRKESERKKEKAAA